MPLCSLLALFSSYSFSLWNYNSYAVLALLVSFIAAVAVLSRTAKSRKDIPLKSRIVIILLPLLVIINWICYIVLASFKTIVLCMPACFICTLIYMLKHIKHKGWKIALAILYILILVPVCFILLLCLLFGNFGSRTVTETVYSPDGKYRAEVINNDMGALGGSTLVNVYNEQVLELYIIKISEKPQCIYEGAWNEYNDIKIIWTDNRTVLVNGKRHQLL